MRTTRLRPRTAAVCAVLMIVAVSSAVSEEEEERGLVLSGKAWADAGALMTLPDSGEADFGYTGVAGLKLGIVNADRTVIRFDAAAEAALYYGALAEPALSLKDALLASIAAGAGIPPDLLASLGLSGENALLALSLTRLSLRYDADFLALTLGRQIVNFGKGALFSPADLFGKPALMGVETTRSGVDAARLSVPLGDLAALDAVAAPGRELDLGTYLARGSASIGKFDAALGGGNRAAADEWLITGEFLANVGIGLSAEAALSLPGGDAPDGGPRIRAQGGAQYSWDEWLLRGEYYFNGKSTGSGYADPAPASDALAAFPLAHNAFLMASWSPSDFFSLSAVLLQSFSASDAEENPGAAALSVAYKAYPGCAFTATARVSWDDSITVSLGAGTELKF